VSSRLDAFSGSDSSSTCFFVGRTLGGAVTGDAKITKGYKLPACVISFSLLLSLRSFVSETPALPPSAYVIHAVGPIYETDEKALAARQLQSCYERSLDLAVVNSVGSVVRLL
jgi:O-acetyl-ADP-ribose deacetylase (regulator of RNase III)